jgi:hypothetical protein
MRRRRGDRFPGLIRLDHARLGRLIGRVALDQQDDAALVRLDRVDVVDHDAVVRSHLPDLHGRGGGNAFQGFDDADYCAHPPLMRLQKVLLFPARSLRCHSRGICVLRRWLRGLIQQCTLSRRLLRLQAVLLHGRGEWIMRHLQWPTLQQWGCAHQWHVTHTRAGWREPWPRVRYVRCGRCGLRVKTEERLAIPWGEGDLVAQVKSLLPVGEGVHLRDKGIAELPLGRLNVILARHGLMIQASNGPDAKRSVACSDQYGRVEPYEVFELQHKATKRQKRNGGH